MNHWNALPAGLRHILFGVPKSRDQSLGAVTTQVGSGDGATSRPWLLAIGEGVMSTHPLPEGGAIVIGRARECDVRIEHPSVSRRHIRLHVGPPLEVEDLGSQNGTRVRDRALDAGQRVRLAPGEVIDLGSIMVIVQERGSLAPTPRRIWPHGAFEARLEGECARGGSFAVVHVSSRDRAGIERALAEVLRVSDLAGEYGPDEYELLLLEAGPEQAQELFARLVAPDRKVGLACFPGDGRSADALLSHARAAARGVAEDGRAVVVDGAMRELERLVERIAQGTISVLIMGETGVGKEILAERVHRLSPRAGRPFVRLNCAALSESLVESELFGHERGAFTGAGVLKPGLLETADGGTVFLDEVGELPLAVQAKLLRVLEDRQVQRVGALKPRAIDVRFVAATNRDLEAEVQRGRFREDLYFRLNGISLVIPPLRQRVSEISGLARAFISLAARASSRAEPVLSREALALLEGYRWPGNIRELRNAMERAVLLCTGREIGLAHLPVDKLRAGFSAPQPTPPPTPSPTPAPRPTPGWGSA
jgi:MoxR-like ATPase